MILVYCRDCHALVAGRDIDLTTALWAAADHEAEHTELVEDDEHEPFEHWRTRLKEET